MLRDAPVINTRFPRSSMVGAYAHRRCHRGAVTYGPALRDIDTIDSELRVVAVLRRAARERGGPLPSIDVANALVLTIGVAGQFTCDRRLAWCSSHIHIQ